MKPIFLYLAAVLAVTPCLVAQAPADNEPAQGPDAVVQGSYVRYVHGQTNEAPTPDAMAPDRLQTSVVRFEKDGETVDLVGVVHLADPDYYRELDRRLAEYDAVLYELVGGPHPGKEAPPEGSAPGGEVGEGGALRQIQQLAKGFLGLEFQLDGIDYSAPNFVHADLAWDEMNSLMESRSESFAGLLGRALSLADEGGLAGLPSDEAEFEGLTGRIFSSVLAGDSNGLKRSLAPFLSKAENFVVQIEGEEGTVLVAERNRVAMERLAEERARRAGGRYAILYGAGHMPDFERRLFAEGFVKRETDWLDAWTIHPPGSPAAAPAGPPPLQSLLRAFTENPEVQEGLRELGEMLEQLGGAAKSLAPESPGEGR